MGEIFGGIVVVVVFIAFVMWKNKGKTQKPNSLRDLNEQQYWAEKDNEKPEIDSGGFDSDDGDD